MWPPKNNFRPGQPIAAIPADWLNTIANFVRDLSVFHGHITRPRQDGRGAIIVVDASESASLFSPDHSFKFLQTSNDGGDITAGKVWLSGVSIAISGLPASLSSLDDGDTHYYFVEVDLTASTATWSTNTTGFANGTDTIERVPIVEIATAAAGITSYIQRCTSDIHIARAAGT